VIADALTVAAKEWKEYLFSGVGLRGGRAGLAIMLLVFGVLLPAQSGISWITSPILLAVWSWVPLMLVAGVVADSFAGERERHTLETLLASRLPDAAIYAGKLAAAVGYGWGFTLSVAIVGLVSVNLIHWQGRVIFYPAMTVVGLPLFSLLTSLLAASAGVLVSLRAPTARQASQMLSIALMIVFFVPFFGVQALPAGVRAALSAAVLGADAGLLTGGLAAALLLVDGVLIAVGLLRFRRARLILD
jgi:ABC-2 type transport system permease protein